MRRKTIINSLNKILPDQTRKDIILNNILTSKLEKRQINYKFLVPVVSCSFVIGLILFNNNVSNNVPSTVRYISNEIIYDGECFQESGEYTGSISDLDFIEESKEFIMGSKIYKNGESIFFQNNDRIIEFTKCERN